MVTSSSMRRSLDEVKRIVHCVPPRRHDLRALGLKRARFKMALAEGLLTGETKQEAIDDAPLSTAALPPAAWAG